LLVSRGSCRVEYEKFSVEYEKFAERRGQLYLTRYYHECEVWNVCPPFAASEQEFQVPAMVTILLPEIDFSYTRHESLQRIRQARDYLKFFGPNLLVKVPVGDEKIAVSVVCLEVLFPL